MKIHFEHGKTSVTLERQPMPEGRFQALCSLGLAAIAGGVFLGAVALAGFWAIPWSVLALLLVGAYKLIRAGAIGY